MTDMDSDYDEVPEPTCVFRSIVSIRKHATGTHLILECKHVILATHHNPNVRLGDPHACFHCSEKLLTDLMKKYAK